MNPIIIVRPKIWAVAHGFVMVVGMVQQLVLLVLFNKIYFTTRVNRSCYMTGVQYICIYEDTTKFLRTPFAIKDHRRGRRPVKTRTSRYLQ